MSRTRLDQALVARGLVPSRARARDAIKRGSVSVDGMLATKASQMVSEEMDLRLSDPASGYVSRAALKLIHALDHFGFDPTGRTCVDVGASTGGFCQVLLERGADAVYGVDVGHGQMHESLRGNDRLTVLEGVNARHLDRTHIPKPYSALVSDVSFISLKLALPPALEMAEAGAFAALLVKPQFEVGREGIGKGGLVRDPADADRVARAIADWIHSSDEGGCAGWHVLDLVPSPILGGDGNREFLLGAEKR
ncbi:23S rRNA (cytidine1920-2'-O)/16S rRNA (cytidine1409-2'-O)-methyltransferase [Cohaesibacter sp. ES.047]|uniref:TlyA family RNA methyltransferase n=1 Tax=Cohaesibacter sp. ES.047 TaxID=1798205 RepID=UPI000BB84EED|nr:TlyA family RNA methyltransferase [Cohaesibacter sp. ES.047]SNY92512.1 23S rRNA (cytidine1920-2'-O)/16S rRNA (cytidine1409-2'-O)-methyltransferase [Cohaesibacter sp. ES.047]